MQQHKKTDISSIKKSSRLQFEQNSFILPLIYPTKSIAALRKRGLTPNPATGKHNKLELVVLENHRVKRMLTSPLPVGGIFTVAHHIVKGVFAEVEAKRASRRFASIHGSFESS